MSTKSISILGLALVVSALIVGLFFYSARKTENSIRVVGYASKQFQSDIVKWTLSISRKVSAENVAQGYKLLKQDLTNLNTALTTNGIPADEITINPPSIQPIWSNEGPRNYSINQSLFVISQKVEKIESLARAPDIVYEKDIFLENSHLEYNYTRIDELKKELLAAATQDAIERAKEIAKSARARLDRIIAARQGVFQITEPYSTEVSDYGIYSTATRTKDIRVTVTVTFAIK
ncbi:MAG: SIMPL domain-containing protein [bacterium]